MVEPMTDDTTPFDELSRRQKAKLKDQQREFRAVLAHEPSRRFLRRLIDVAGVFNPTAELGQRQIGLWVIEEINRADPHAFGRLLTEAANETRGDNDAD